ncbi:MAG: phosphatase PAP2 family protein [Brucellaceae bacterium]|nr:phosphatase PAP2 family protein [Brucellaceae bacterium]
MEIAARSGRLVLSGRLLAVIGASASFVAFMGSFLSLKMQIPHIRPFAFDPLLSRLDAALFGGHQPWQVLHPLLGHEAATRFLDGAYALWVPTVFLTWLYAFCSARVDGALRRQYTLSVLASWFLVGNVMAVALSSAGPVYFGHLYPGRADPYAGLFAYLETLHASAPLGALEMRDYLWAVYSGRLDGMAGGISAMPSMHNAQAVLFALFAYRLHRGAGHAMAAYAVLIFVGSIHLGWHYASDGLAGGAAAFAIWRASGRLTRRSGGDVITPQG